MNKKKGSIEIIAILIFVLLLILILICFFVLTVQINKSIYGIKSDIFYIVQNSYMALNNEKLGYYEYDISEDKLISKIQTLINKNNSNISIKSLNYNKNTNYVDIEIIINFKPVVFSNILKNVKINLKENIKLKMMEVR